MTLPVRNWLLGIALGTFISFTFLIFIALWPLSPGINPPVPDVLPQASTGPVLSAPPIPPPDQSDETEPNAAALPPNPPAPVPPEEIPQSGPAHPAVTGKPDVPPTPEIKKSEKPTKIIPEVPRAATKEESPPAPVKPAPESTTVASLDPSDLDRVHSLLHRLKTSFEAKDLPSLKKIMKLSMDQESSLNIIFDTYKNIRTELESTQPIENGVSGGFLIISMENERGNIVFPGPRWAKQPFTIPSDDRRWNQVVLVGTTFTHPPAVGDLIAPSIFHSLPAYTASPGRPTQISATIVDNTKILEVTLHFRAQGDREYETAPMSEGTDHAFTGVIPGSMIKANRTSMEYYIKAKDGEGNVSLEGRPNAPLIIAVVQPPEG